MKCPHCNIDLCNCDHCKELFSELNEVYYKNFNEKTQKFATRTHKTYLCDECLKEWRGESEKN